MELEGFELLIHLLQENNCDDHRFCDMGDLIISISHVISHVNWLKLLRNFMIVYQKVISTAI